MWKVTSVICGVLVLASCTQTPEQTSVTPGKLAGGVEFDTELSDEPTSSELPETKGFTYVDSIKRNEKKVNNAELISAELPANDSVQVVTDTMGLMDFIHTVFGESLGVNYVISDEVTKRNDTVTLNVQQGISSRRLFRVANELLESKGLDIAKRDGIFYIFPATGAQQGEVAIGIGNQEQDIPQAFGQVLQIIPLRYGLNASLERTLNNLSPVQTTPDYNQGVIFAQGQREQIIRLLELIRIIDTPAHQGKFIGLAELQFINTEDYTSQIQSLLDSEGIDVSIGSRGSAPVVLVPLEQIGAVAIFSGDDHILDRVQFWTDKIDQPSKGEEKRFFLYNPIFARADDLGSSIQPLIGQSTSAAGGNRSRDTQSAQNGNNESSSSGSRSSSASGKLDGESIQLTVDSRSNTLIFYSTGEQYQKLLPIVKQLDVMPKQILLEATIAEITLTEEFAQGFEFAIQNGNFGLGNLGAFGVEDIAGLAADYMTGPDRFIARLAATNSKVNVLSNPRLVVRDGVSASISVGTDIPTVGSTTSRPLESEAQTTNVEYRKTGLQLTVTPVINAQGLVVMEIDQQISSTTDSGSTVAGSPAIFERTLSTEVLSQSGQTILLGGLISEDTNNATSKVPGFGDIPLFGRLFSARTQSKTKTELVIFITPRVVTNMSSWYGIMEELNKGLESLQVISVDNK
ncbi:hypothetical protein LG288_02555 [Idiomarina seosinensis]|uniref:secretin N-terminal domain-containing protein n=1 Tax=Idiomarina seosinensis TaxID=281739 RepID=UPI00384DA975